MRFGNPLDASPAVTGTQLYNGLAVNGGSTGPLAVGGFKSVLIVLTSGVGASGTKTATPAWLDATGAGYLTFGTAITVESNAGTIFVQLRAMSPFLQLNFTGGGAGNGSCIVWGSNRDSEYDGPYTPGQAGRLLVQDSRAYIAGGQVTFNAYPIGPNAVQYAGPAVCAIDTSLGGTCRIRLVENGSLIPLDGLNAFTAGGMAGISPTPAREFWIPPRPCSLIVSQDPGTAQNIAFSLMARAGGGGNSGGGY